MQADGGRGGAGVGGGCSRLEEEAEIERRRQLGATAAAQNLTAPTDAEGPRSASLREHSRRTRMRATAAVASWYPRYPPPTLRG